MISLMLTLFLTGIGLGAGPCMASCGPLLISYTAATKKGFKDSMRVYIIFSLTRIFVYLILGVLIGLFSQAIFYQKYQVYITKTIYFIGATIILLIGVSIILGKNHGFKFCQSMRKKLIERDTKSIIFFGLVVGIAPCAPLIGVLYYIGLTSLSWLKALLLSFAFGLGTVFSPLIFLVVASGFITKLFKNEEKIYQIFQIFCGAILCILGLHLYITTLISGPPKF